MTDDQFSDALLAEGEPASAGSPDAAAGAARGPSSGAAASPLRRQLLDVAWEIVAESGVEALSIRAVARRAGVSHAAPHHYFSDKAELVRTLAVEGYDALAESLMDAMRRYPDDAFLQLTAIGIAYVRFAVDHPDIFRLMNRPEMRTADGVVAEHAARAVEVLEDVVSECQRAGMVRPGPARQWSFVCWSTVHGLAVLLIDGLLEPVRPVLPDGTPLSDHIITIWVLDALGRGTTADHERIERAAAVFLGGQAPEGPGGPDAAGGPEGPGSAPADSWSLDIPTVNRSGRCR